MEGLTEAAASLQKAILEGDTEEALKLVDHFPNETLSSDKIQDKWALHCLHPVAFQDATRLEFTKQVIMKYIGAGWDVDSTSTLDNATRFGNFYYALSKYTTLLHLACIYGSPEVIKLLVKEAGADVNCLTTGDAELTPLHILLLQKEWECAKYLVEMGVDLNLVGTFNIQWYFTGFANKVQKLAVGTTLNPVQLLVRLGFQKGLPVLDQILVRTEDDPVIWQGARELHLALEGANPNYVTKVLQRCSKLISTEDLSWITFEVHPGLESVVRKRVPTLLWLIHTINMSLMTNTDLLDLVKIMAHLINMFVERGYNLNLVWSSTSLLTFYPPIEPLLLYALGIGVVDESNLLLRTVLQVDHLQLSWVTSSKGHNPVEHLLDLFDYRCGSSNSRRRCCWERKVTPNENPVAAVRLLVTHGLDLSGMVIRREFNYHCGYKPIIQMLYRAGAKICDEFFCRPPFCFQRDLPVLARQEMTKEILELKEWKEEFDQRNGMG